jgi:hypothetical protein
MLLKILRLTFQRHNLKVTASTDIFPSSTLKVNDIQLFQYNQPSFRATHGYKLDRTIERFPREIPLRPTPLYINDKQVEYEMEKF